MSVHESSTGRQLYIYHPSTQVEKGSDSSLVGSYHSRYMPLTNRTVTADFPTPPQPITAHF